MKMKQNSTHDNELEEALNDDADDYAKISRVVYDFMCRSMSEEDVARALLAMLGRHMLNCETAFCAGVLNDKKIEVTVSDFDGRCDCGDPECPIAQANEPVTHH